MLTLRTLMYGVIALWGLAVLLALAGYAVDSDVLRGSSVPLRRLALAVTIVWAALAGLAGVWRRIRGQFRRPPGGSPR